VARVNPNFTGGTYVWTRGDEQLAASIMDEEYRMMYLPAVNKFKIDDKDFNKQFTVCTTFPSQAREIITDAFASRLLHFKNQLGRDIQVSVVAGKCFVAIPFDEDLLEPMGAHPENKEQVKKYFFTILLVLSIINQLHLSNLVE
jgi:hypothetical protein